MITYIAKIIYHHQLIFYIKRKTVKIQLVIVKALLILYEKIKIIQQYLYFIACLYTRKLSKGIKHKLQKPSNSTRIPQNEVMHNHQ